MRKLGAALIVLVLCQLWTEDADARRRKRYKHRYYSRHRVIDTRDVTDNQRAVPKNTVFDVGYVPVDYPRASGSAIVDVIYSVWDFEDDRETCHR